jgi:type II secretory pathway pseudopilin PulG
MLIEVMVGAMILAITTTAVLNGLDGAQKTGGRNKARSVAAALAEQDQERMKAMPASQLVSYIATPYSRPVTVNGVSYTVVSSAAYAADAGSVSTGCSASAKTQTNLKITSTVSSPLTRGNVDLVGLVTPPASSGFTAGQGRIIVKVVDRDQAPRQGITVALAGSQSFSEETNAAGCAIFSFVPAGAYNATIQGAPYFIDWDGVGNPVEAVTSTAGQTTTYGPYEMEEPATINAQFQTKVGSFAAVSSKSRYIEYNNAKLAVQWPMVDDGTNAANWGTVTTPEIYPFLDGYGVYAGQCSQNQPSAALLQNVSVSPNTATTTNPKIWTPSINIRVLNAGGTAVPTTTTTIFVTTADGCSTTYPSQTMTNTTTTTGGGVGAMPEPGFPYGSYKICAQTTISGTTTHGHADQKTGTSPGVYDTRQTASATAETAANLVNDTIVNNAQAGVPNIAANPIYPATPILPAQLNSIIIRLNRNGACH